MSLAPKVIGSGLPLSVRPMLREWYRRTSGAPNIPSPRPRGGPKLKLLAASRKNSRLLREEEREAGQVHPLLVHLHLGKVGVVGQLRGQVGVDLDLEVLDAEIGGALRQWQLSLGQRVVAAAEIGFQTEGARSA